MDTPYVERSCFACKHQEEIERADPCAVYVGEVEYFCHFGCPQFYELCQYYELKTNV